MTCERAMMQKAFLPVCPYIFVALKCSSSEAGSKKKFNHTETKEFALDI